MTYLEKQTYSNRDICHDHKTAGFASDDDYNKAGLGFAMVTAFFVILGAAFFVALLCSFDGAILRFGSGQ